MSKLFSILVGFHLKNPKLQKHFRLLPKKFQKNCIQLVVPVATSYPHIALIERVGELTLEIGGLGGGFGVLGEVFNHKQGHSLHFGGGRGGTCDSEP
jgi:hypothetical protein